ncbi:acyl-CoA desaturase [Actinokineospora sp. NBRC 105648]|uniref:fatty acid desaturase family protein n=1 Tax=Actinokineospora sp. NBRC 105648 TaxID=3032206 RepID=UPI0024A0848B|nr:acyl-CoA desaturase [Actinokineospora sp. NBRC 105648]GLZ42484.1 fatty acid desaturase [Actinokineospora sp. NBRC 105648]
MSTNALDSAPPSAPAQSATFTELLKRVKKEGLLDLQAGWYYRRIALNMGMFLAGVAAFFVVGDSPWQLLIAVWCGVWCAQMSFMFHDAGHKSMFRARQSATVVGYTHANLVNGFSYGWWVNHHNRHHSHPNHLSLDPDIGRRTAIFDIKQYATRTPVQRFIVRYQAVLFFILLTLESYKMQKTAVKMIAKRGELKQPLLELGLILLRQAIYLTCLFTVLNPVLAIGFLLVQQAVMGVYFGMIFAPNHKGMEIRDGEEETLDWLERQVLTSRNINPSPLMDFMYGGLNYQIEHHLFPAMPQKSLARARELTIEYCQEKGIPYHELGFWASYKEVANFLHDVSAPARHGEVTVENGVLKTAA